MVTRAPVLLVDAKPVNGGGQRVLADLLRALDGRRTVLVRPLDAPEPATFFAASRIIRLPFPRFPTGLARRGRQLLALPGVAAIALRLWPLLLRERPGVVVANDVYSLIPLRPLCRLLGVPLVFYAHSVDVPANRHTTWLLAGCARIICCAQAVRRALRAVDARCTVVLNGVDPEGRSTADAALRRVRGWDGDWVCGFAGRLDANKNLAALLTAFAAVCRRLDGDGRTARLLVLGDGPERDGLTALAGRLGLADRVHFAGWIAEPLPLMADLDAFVLPSRLEALPLSLIEAQLLGVPVMATAVGGVPEIISDGLTGILSPTADPADLSAALLRLRATDRDGPLALAARALARERFSPARYRRDVLAALAAAEEGDL